MLRSKLLIRLSTRTFHEIFGLILCFCILNVCSPKNVFSAEDSPESWQSLESKYTFLRYHTIGDLNKFDRVIAYSPGRLGFPNIFKKSDPKKELQKIARKVDTLYEKVQEILDMRKPFDKINIDIYADKKRSMRPISSFIKNPVIFVRGMCMN